MAHKYINGIKVGINTKDLTNKNFGRLTVKELSGRHETRCKNPLMWLCVCECGNVKTVCSADLSSGSTTSCGCLLKEVNEVHKQRFKNEHQTHGWAGSREYKAWKRIKQRCLNKNSKDFEVYSKIGIGEDIANDFLNFLEDIGQIQDDMPNKVSIDRIDNTKGYIKGNIRWATDEQQARNKGMYSNNSSGFTGVRLHIGKDGKEYWCASWYPIKGRQKSKYFSILKHGDELARFLAEEYRQQQIDLLNLAGAGYSEYHGKNMEGK